MQCNRNPEQGSEAACIRGDRFDALRDQCIDDGADSERLDARVCRIRIFAAPSPPTSSVKQSGMPDMGKTYPEKVIFSAFIRPCNSSGTFHKKSHLVSFPLIYISQPFMANASKGKRLPYDRCMSDRRRSSSRPRHLGARMRILVVEDDPVQAEEVQSALASFSHTIKVAVNGEQALRFLRSESVDAVVLDWHLPSMTGIEVLNWIRTRADVEYGVLFLTSRVQELDVVRALEAGADDYLSKPFRAEELAARVNALLRRVARNVKRDEPIRAGEYVLDPVARAVWLRDSKIELTTKEFQLVACLFHNLGKLMSRELLATTAWGRELGTESRSLDTHIYRIRQKLKLGIENGLRLSAVYTLGYRLDQTKASADPSAEVHGDVGMLMESRV
ncbi:response regulator transcription factor [Burkholderia pyrrocinia]|uniref:response regulator transcription factor n=1 Tax=Burkholderia pyrrocinia TaxID=60550 RepID=UPI0030CD5394